MSPLLKETFLLAKKHFNEYQRFTSANLICFVDESVSLSRKRRMAKTLYELYSMGFMKRETIKNVHHYWWTRQTYHLFKDDSPVIKKALSNDELDKEHELWVKQIEQRKNERERIRSACR